MKKTAITILLITLLSCGQEKKHTTMTEPDNNTATTASSSKKPNEEWEKILTPEQFRVLRKAGTETPFGKAYEEFKKQGGGTYHCAACNAELFSSAHKFDAHCGWPAFYDAANNKNIITRDDYSTGNLRTEVLCAKCDSHLGHLFKGENLGTPKDQRYCINGVCLKFVPEKDNPEKK